MFRRVCITEVATDTLPALVAKLPPGVYVTDTAERIGRNVTTLKLEGDGLPEWCSVADQGGSLVFATPFVDGDGVVQFLERPPQPLGRCRCSKRNPCR